jgi:hypothetical protein
MLPIKKNFSHPLFGVYLIFLFFFDDKVILRYNGGTSTANIRAQDTRARLMFWEVILGKNPPVAKGVKTQKQTVTRLTSKVCKCGL